MKNIFKFAAMAFAAVVLAGMANSCEPEETITLDGKQWVTIMGEGETAMGIFLDFGLKKEGILCSGYCDPVSFESMMGQSLGAYEITATNATSGTISVAGYDMMTGNPAMINYSYRNLTENSVEIDMGIIYGMPTMGDEIPYATFNIAASTIEFEDMYDM